MDTTVKAIIWLIAVLLALLAAVWAPPAPVEGRVSLLGRVSLFPLAFALWVFPWMWDAFEAS